jgi:23S rRNA (cytosine1962-C5)-methyltransferase
LKSSTNWRDYEIIATGGGEKLERWGSVILLRPDPQAIWSADFDLAKYDGLNAHYIRSVTGGGKWHILKKFPDEWTISYGDMKFLISPTNFKHTGLFPEQAVNWDKMCGAFPPAPPLPSNPSYKYEVLNLFGYTGGATVACAKSGANVTHVDASQGMVSVCKRNCELNGLSNVRYIVDDCLKFVLREIRRGKKYDAIIMDPPSFGRGTNGEGWKIETDWEPLVLNCVKLLSSKPLFFLINSYTTGLQPQVIKNILQRCFEKQKICATIDAYEIGLPTNERTPLPAGASAWASF